MTDVPPRFGPLDDERLPERCFASPRDARRLTGMAGAVFEETRGFREESETTLTWR